MSLAYNDFVLEIGGVAGAQRVAIIIWTMQLPVREKGALRVHNIRRPRHTILKYCNIFFNISHIL
jgi:hypothetical protein